MCFDKKARASAWAFFCPKNSLTDQKTFTLSIQWVSVNFFYFVKYFFVSVSKALAGNCRL